MQKSWVRREKWRVGLCGWGGEVEEEEESWDGRGLTLWDLELQDKWVLFFTPNVGF